MSFFQELQRRKVIRTVIAYGAAAFVAAQITQLLVDALGLPEWILRAVVIGAIVALPFVVGLAWAFDASRQGVTLTSDASPAARTFPWRRLALPFAASLTLLLAAFLFLEGDEESLDDDLVAVLPFHVSGDPQIGYLHEGMVDLLAAKLNGEGGPRAADPRGVMSIVRRQSEDDAGLSDKAATGIARAVGSGQVLVGSVVGTPAQFTIHARLLRVPSGRLVVEAEQTASADSLLQAVDKLVVKLLSLQAGEGPQRLDQLMTTSLPALRSYLDGRVAYRTGHFAKAADQFGKALDADSTFALAAIGQYMTGGWGEGSVDRGRMRRTLTAYRDRLGKVDHAIATAISGANPEEAKSWKQRIADWENVVTMAPDHLDAWFWYADFVFHWGGVIDLERHTQRADEAFQKILQRDSTYVPALLHRIDGAIRLDQPGVIRQLEPLRKQLDPSETAALYQRSRRIRFLGDSAAIAAERAAFDTMSLDALQNAAAAGGTIPGSIRDAVRALELYLQKATTRRDRVEGHWIALDRYLMWGMPTRAEAMAQQLIALGEEYTPVMQVVGALYWDGDAQAGERAAGQLTALMETARDSTLQLYSACFSEQWRLWRNDTSRYDAVRRLLAATPAHKRGDKIFADLCLETTATIRSVVSRANDLPARVQALNTILREGPAVEPFILNSSNIVLGRAAEQAGDRALAQRAFGRQPGGGVYSVELVTTMMREHARLAAINGNRDLAIREYRRYLSLHEQAEPAVRKTDDVVRRHLARLSGERANE